MTSWGDLMSAGVVRRDEPLAPLTTYKMGGPARLLADVSSVGELLAVTVALESENVLVLGRGSNIIISDLGFDGLVIRLSGEFLDVSIDSGGAVIAGGASPLPRVARVAAKAGRGGLEFLVGIPGSVGGAVAMNAGCHGSETSEWLVSAGVVDLATSAVAERSVEELEMGYRTSAVGRNNVVTAATFRSIPRPRAEAQGEIREITQWRKEHQPGGTFNAGSVFKNPPGDHAGRIIDELGLKGMRRGRASVSRKHANFFVAEPGTPAQDVYDLVWAVRRQVGERTGVWLTPEVRFVGEFASSPDEVAAT